MRVLLIGSGGREHSLAQKLCQSSRLSHLFCAPGNPGTDAIATNVSIASTDIPGLILFVKKNQIDLTIVGPEVPLISGIANAFEKENLSIIGPFYHEAQLEGSKSWAKDVMKKAAIPTADATIVSSFEKGMDVIRKSIFPVVIKADGLAQGKGVCIVFNHHEASQALEDCFIKHRFGTAGQTVVIESFLQVEEASVLAFCDGKTILPMAAVQDHKRAFDHDKGPNTGGMGAYSPVPVVTNRIMEDIQETIFNPLLRFFQKEKMVYKGILYAGLMIHQNKASVVEFNVRFGDPETQVVLPRLENDLLDIFIAITTQTLHEHTLRWKPDHASCVILASKGYPDTYPTHTPITVDDIVYKNRSDLFLVHAGTARLPNGQLVTQGGRVFGVVGLGETLQDSLNKVYTVGIPAVQFEHCFFRTDIGYRVISK